MVLQLFSSLHTWFSQRHLTTVGQRRRTHRNLCYYNKASSISHFHSKDEKLRKRMKMSLAKILLILLVCGICLPFLYIFLLNPPTAMKLIKEKALNIRETFQENSPLADYDEGIDIIPETGNKEIPEVKFTEDDFKAFQEDQYQRKTFLRAACKKLGLLARRREMKKEDFSSILVNDPFGFMYCQIPKVACTNWRRVLLVLTGYYNTTKGSRLKSMDVHNSYDKYLTYLSDLSAGGISYRLRNYKKFLFVREPFQRLVSAFRNKIHSSKNEYFFQRFGRIILKRYRNSSMSESSMRKTNVKFSEFVQYLLDMSNKKTVLNDHWGHFSPLCHPCAIKYDFIGKYETLERDAHFILRNLAPNKSVTFPSRNETYRHTQTNNDLVLKNFKTLSPATINKLWKMYRKDYYLFNYSYPQWLQSPQKKLNFTAKSATMKQIKIKKP
ncbi:carbohydrate sulfotransferase 11-like [Argonauta hians]